MREKVFSLTVSPPLGRVPVFNRHQSTVDSTLLVVSLSSETVSLKQAHCSLMVEKLHWDTNYFNAASQTPHWFCSSKRSSCFVGEIIFYSSKKGKRENLQKKKKKKITVFA